MLIYVDDIWISGDSSSFIDQFVTRLNHVFALEDMSLLSYYLGVEVHRTASRMYLLQAKYILLICLIVLVLSHIKSCTTPALTGKKFSTYDGEPMSNPTLYRSVLGAL